MDRNFSQIELVKDLNPGTEEQRSDFPRGSFPSQLFEFHERLYFTADDGGVGRELWVSDGTSTGTELLLDINQGSNYGYIYGSQAKYFTEYADRLYFVANDGVNGSQVWVTDGTEPGTQVVSNIRPQGQDSRESESAVNNLIVFDDRLFFTVNDAASGKEIWATDGTTTGTQLVADINPNTDDNYYYAYEPISNSADAVNLEIVSDRLFFAANDGSNGRELWVSDGTTAGTQLVKDIAPGIGDRSYETSALSADPAYLTEFAGKLYFSATDSQGNRELWTSDGTGAGTQLVKDIYPDSDGAGYVYSSRPRDFIQLGDKLYFSARSEVGRELWVTDGTATGTQLVKDINPIEPDENEPFAESSSFPSYFVEYEHRLYFTADDGITGNELWVTDGTEAGTQLVKDINPSISSDGDFSFPQGSNITELVEFGGKLYFAADDGVNGNELWVTDGTTEGTILVEDLNPGSNEFNPPEDFAYADGTSYASYQTFVSELTVVGDRLFFAADDGVTGTELFQLTANDNDEIALAGSFNLTLTHEANDSLFAGEFELNTGTDKAGDRIELQIRSMGKGIPDLSFELGANLTWDDFNQEVTEIFAHPQGIDLFSFTSNDLKFI